MLKYCFLILLFTESLAANFLLEGGFADDEGDAQGGWGGGGGGDDDMYN